MDLGFWQVLALAFAAGVGWRASGFVASFAWMAWRVMQATGRAPPESSVLAARRRAEAEVESKGNEEAAG